MLNINTNEMILPEEESLGLLMKKKIEEHCENLNQTCPLFSNAKKGLVTPLQLVNFIDNIFYLIQHTQILLRIARRVCEDRNMEELSNFYEVKLEEETGHEMWAIQDMVGLEKKFKIRARRMVSQPMFQMVELIHDGIQQDPTLYLSYIMLAEYATVLLTPPWAKDLESQCGIPPQFISVLCNHVELDKKHVMEMTEMIDRFAPKKKYSKQFTHHVDSISKLHRSFCTEMAMIQ